MKKLTFRLHAERRMRQRDVTEAEVKEVLAQREEHGFFNPDHGTMNVRHRFPNIGMTLLVAYEELDDEVIVVTVIDE